MDSIHATSAGAFPDGKAAQVVLRRPQETNPRVAFPHVFVSRRPAGLTPPRAGAEAVRRRNPGKSKPGATHMVACPRGGEVTPLGHATLGMPFPTCSCHAGRRA